MSGEGHITSRIRSLDGNRDDGRKETLVERFEGKRFNAPNDLAIDTRGRIYFTDPRYLGDEPKELDSESVYRLDPDGSVRRIAREVEKPNGIALSADDRPLYVADTNKRTIGGDAASRIPGAMKVYAFPLDREGLVAGPRRTIYDFGREMGCDGMTLDARSNLYLTTRSETQPGIVVIDPSGKRLGFLPTRSAAGADAGPMIPANVEFGRGEDAGTLYVVIDTSLYRVKLKP